MTTITIEWLDEQERLAREATQKPWEAATSSRVDNATGPICLAVRHPYTDAAHIAASRESVPLMAAALQRVIEECEATIRATDCDRGGEESQAATREARHILAAINPLGAGEGETDGE